MHFGNDNIGQCSLVLHADEDKNIRPSEARMGLFDSGDLFDRLDYVLGLSGFDFNQDVRARCHASLLGVWLEFIADKFIVP